MKFPQSSAYDAAPLSEERIAARARVAEARAARRTGAIAERRARSASNAERLRRSGLSSNPINDLAYSMGSSTAGTDSEEGPLYSGYSGAAAGELYLASLVPPGAYSSLAPVSERTTVFSFSASTGGWRPRRRHELRSERSGLAPIRKSPPQQQQHQSSDTNTMRRAQRAIDAAFTIAVEKLPHSLSPNELLQCASTSSVVHAAFSEAAKTVAAEAGAVKLDAGGLIGRLWREHCEPLYSRAKGFEDELLEAETHGSLEGDGPLMRRVRAIVKRAQYASTSRWSSSRPTSAIGHRDANVDGDASGGRIQACLRPALLVTPRWSRTTTLRRRRRPPPRKVQAQQVQKQTPQIVRPPSRL